MPEVDSVAGALRRVQAYETEWGLFAKGKVSWRLVTVAYTTVCTSGFSLLLGQEGRYCSVGKRGRYLADE